jgi:integrase
LSRAKTGTLVRPGRDGIWKGRVTAGDGSRPLYSLGTADEAAAKRKLARLVAGELPAAISDDSVKEYSDAWLEKREAQGVGMSKKERRILEMYVLEAIGRMPLVDVKPSHIRSILDSAAATGLARKTVSGVRGVLNRLFRAALEDERIIVNPIAAVRMPRMREVKRERMILTDDEFTRFVACADVDLELRMLSVVARCEGGMRTGDLHRWDWSQIDRLHFAECIVPRAKTGTPQVLAIPDVLAPFLRAWWERATSPTTGPVFPTRTGKRAGQAKKPENSYAKRLRRALAVAGVFREQPVEEVRQLRNGRGQNVRTAARLAPSPRDPLYFETASTLPVDFHSFRRAFASALAGANVNAQHAMALTGHSDPKVHARYVMSTAAMRAIPANALPTLPEALPIATPIVRARDESSRRRVAASHDTSLLVAPAVGLEPTTRRLTAACSTN